MIFANFADGNPVIPTQVQHLKSLKYNTLYFQCQNTSKYSGNE